MMVIYHYNKKTLSYEVLLLQLLSYLRSMENWMDYLN